MDTLSNIGKKFIRVKWIASSCAALILSFKKYILAAETLNEHYLHILSIMYITCNPFQTMEHGCHQVTQGACPGSMVV